MCKRKRIKVGSAELTIFNKGGNMRKRDVKIFIIKMVKTYRPVMPLIQFYNTVIREQKLVYSGNVRRQLFVFTSDSDPAQVGTRVTSFGW